MGFVTRHKERDAALPQKLQVIQEAVYNDLVNDSNVLAFFYGGSIAEQRTDQFSDLDLRIVVKEEAFDEYRSNKKKRANRWGEVLFYEDFPLATHSVAHYKDFLKVDSFYYKPKDIQPSIYLKQTKIVFDPYSIVANAVEKSQEIQYILTIEEFEIWRGKFFAHMHEVYRRVLRGELYYALSSLDKMRSSIAMGWDMEIDRNPNQLGDWSKYEGNRTHLESWQLRLLEKWECTRNPLEILNVLKAITPEFKRVHKVLCEKVGVKENAEWVEEIIELVN